MKRLAGLLTAIFVGVSAIEGSAGAEPVPADTEQADLLGGESDVDESDEAAAAGSSLGGLFAHGGHLLCSSTSEVGSARQGHAAEIRFPPWA